MQRRHVKNNNTGFMKMDLELCCKVIKVNKLADYSQTVSCEGVFEEPDMIFLDVINQQRKIEPVMVKHE